MAPGGRRRHPEEEYAGNATRWHHLTPETLEAVRAGMAPRARMAVWPPLSPDVDAVLGELPHHGLVEGVWEDVEGHLHSAVAEEDEHPELSWRQIAHPADVVSVGGEIDAKILDIDLVRERVSLSLRALHRGPLTSWSE